MSPLPTARHDIIRLAGGTYALSGNAGEPFAYSSTEDKDLVIEGGWTPDFSQRAANIPTELKNDVPATEPDPAGFWRSRPAETSA